MDRHLPPTLRVLSHAQRQALIAKAHHDRNVAIAVAVRALAGRLRRLLTAHAGR